MSEVVALGRAEPVADGDAGLMARVAEGERGPALTVLYDRFAGRLYGLGLRLLGDAGLAEELVQETFVRLWRSSASFDPERGSVTTFVFTIARRIAIDLWRRPSSRPFEPDPIDVEDERDPVERVIIGVTVRDALQSLSPDHRDVIDLAYGTGLTQLEIAERLGIPLGTVKTRTFHALKALKLALAERGIDA